MLRGPLPKNRRGIYRTQIAYIDYLDTRGIPILIQVYQTRDSPRLRKICKVFEVIEIRIYNNLVHYYSDG